MPGLPQLADRAMDTGGLVTRQQALAMGVRDQRLTELVRLGVIARVARGVYSVGTPLPDPRPLVLAWRVALSHESAAAWWGVDLPKPVRRLSVTAPRSRGRWRDAAPGIRLRRASLARSDLAVVRGVPVTAPVRTCLDIARHAPIAEAVAIIDAFLRARLVDPGELRAAADRTQGPGRRRLMLVMTLVDPASGSILESLTRVLLWRHQLPTPRTQHSFRSARTGWVGFLDFAWPDLRSALECDGYDFHAARQPFQKDRRRWSALSRAGWRLGVVTWFDVTSDPGYVVALVRDLLSPASGIVNRSVTPVTGWAMA